ncbi:hypothetical protein Ciccas_009428 [Cichlidogyrus casuarinus]|uniref:Uncharacterized protein n=1 Tax=Cichlidogyrus casuarinus TaxID=1844966 RepID=A0ABD2PY09_9PLAT
MELFHDTYLEEFCEQFSIMLREQLDIRCQLLQEWVKSSPHSIIPLWDCLSNTANFVYDYAIWPSDLLLRTTSSLLFLFSSYFIQ